MDLYERIEVPIRQALTQAQLKMDDVDQFVLMGAGTRIPKVQTQLQELLGRFVTLCYRLETGYNKETVQDAFMTPRRISQVVPVYNKFLVISYAF